MRSLKRTARITGLGYLVIFFTGFFANFFVLESLVVDGDASTTYANLAHNFPQFRWGVFSFVIMVAVDVLLAWPLYILLEPVNRFLSQISSGLRLVNGIIFGAALFSLFGALQLVAGADAATALNDTALHARTMALLNNFDYIWLIGLVFFGLHLFFLGYLVFRSRYMPAVIGVLLQIAALGYLIDSFAHFLLPNYADYQALFEMIVVIPGVIGEFSLTVWLLVKGVKRMPDALEVTNIGPLRGL